MPRFTLQLAIVVAFGLAAADVAGAEPKVDFASEIRPILAENCFHCHGPDAGNRQADLRLDTEAGAEATVTAGNRQESELFRRLVSTDSGEVMPPPDSNRSLSAEQIETVGRWIDQGAPWGQHWSFKTLVRPELPPLDPPPADGRSVSKIDHFVLDRLARESVEPAPPATPEARLRRVTLDLTGLPPTPAELDAFLADPSQDAYVAAVDSLLHSPAFGERMAWDWLDAARYADSNGYQGDGERSMWPWRDWVVDAFNRNLPFDQFTLWQVAGDLLPDATAEQKLASGFFRNHMINGEGGRIAEENRVEYVFDMTETLGTVWMGLTLNCCRCHDHKFDPLTKQDYFRLFAYFNQTPVDGGGGNPQTPPVLAVPDQDQLRGIEETEGRLAATRARREARAEQLAAELPQWEQAMAARLTQSGRWRTLVPEAVSADIQRLAASADGSVLAAGDNPDQDTYRLTYRPGSGFGHGHGRVTALRIEALRHESMTAGGLARSDSGNFVLTGVEVKSLRQGEPEIALPISGGKASFEQGGYAISGVWDDDPNTGWAVYSGKPFDRDHEAVLTFATPIDVADDTQWVITLRHQSPHRQHNLGRFRISVTDLADPDLGSGDDAFLASLRLSAEQRTDDDRNRIVAAQRAADVAYRDLSAEVEADEKRLASLRAGIPNVMIMGDLAQPRKTYLLQVGLYNKTGDEVTAGVPAFLPGLPDDAPPNRLTLARWLIDDANPLTARVTVNRIWQMFFGIGLVKTPEDFGVQGETPRYRELLDWLAVDFRESGWDVKSLIRQIVTSDAYQRSSRVTADEFERDPENRLLARGPRRRLPAWMLRDQALAISGLLAPRVGGRPVNSYQPPGIWEEATFGQKRYVQDQGESLHRRTLYTFWRRIVAPTMLFDNASRQVCTVSPFLTNTPLHALTTLNETTYVESARAFAERALTEPLEPLGDREPSERTPGDDRARLDVAFRLATARRPTDAEADILLKRLATLRQDFTADVDAAERLLAIGESPRDRTLDPARHAAWAALCSLILNLDETISKP